MSAYGMTFLPSMPVMAPRRVYFPPVQHAVYSPTGQWHGIYSNPESDFQRPITGVSDRNGASWQCGQPLCGREGLGYPAQPVWIAEMTRESSGQDSPGSVGYSPVGSPSLDALLSMRSNGEMSSPSPSFASEALLSALSDQRDRSPFTALLDEMVDGLDSTSSSSLAEDQPVTVGQKSEDGRCPLRLNNVNASVESVLGILQRTAHLPSLEQQDSIVKRARELAEVGREFKKRRTRLGFSQSEISNAMKCLPGKDFSQTTVSRFENLKMSVFNMEWLQPLVTEALERAQTTRDRRLMRSPSTEWLMATVAPPAKRTRRRRTTIPAAKAALLEACFRENPQPCTEDMVRIMKELKLEKAVVRVWFCNRRQREKRRAAAAAPPGGVYVAPPGGVYAAPPVGVHVASNLAVADAYGL